MIELLGISVAIALGFAALVWWRGIRTLVVVSVLSALWVAFVGSSLRGFGSPTGTIPQFDFLDFAKMAAIALPITLIGFTGVYFLSRFLTKRAVSKLAFSVWVTALVLIAAVYFGRQEFLRQTKRNFMVTVGYDEELPLQWDQISAQVFVISGDSSFVSFNVGGGSREKNEYGFKSSLGGSLEIYGPPAKLEISMLGEPSLVFPLSSDSNHAILYFNKKRETKFFEKRETEP